MDDSMAGQNRRTDASDLPEGLSAPARRALSGLGVTSLAELARHSADEISRLHGMGPKGMRLLREALQSSGMKFLDEK